MLHEVLAGITEHVQGHISAVTDENLKIPLNIIDHYQFDHFNPFTTEARFFVLNAIAFST